MVIAAGTDRIRATEVLTPFEIAGGYAAREILPSISRSDAVASSGSVTMTLSVPLGAVLTQVVAHLEAGAPGTTAIGGIAAVRASAGSPEAPTSEAVIDFGAMRTVSALSAPVSISSITPWVGTRFDGAVTLVHDLIRPGGDDVVTFTELQTERLLVGLDGNISPAALAAAGLVTTTTPPADLELTVAGSRVWFRSGPVPAGFTQDVDLTTATQAAVDAATVADANGDVAVPLALTARVPGDLRLTIPSAPGFLRTHLVDFPGPTVPVPFGEEGIADVAIPLPADAVDWVVHRVVVTAVPRDPGPQRVLPPAGPPITAEAELLLDADRRLVVRLPRSALGRFERLAGIRLLIAPQAGGIEIGGSLLTGTGALPGAAVPDATLTPVAVPAGPPAWTSVLWAQPVELGKAAKPAPDDAFWVAISVSRGSARLGLADGPAMPEPDRAVLRRVAPNGLVKPLSAAYRPRANPGDAAVPVAGDTLALRLVGVAPPAAPIELVAPDVAPAGSGPPAGSTVRTPGLAGSSVLSLDPVGPRSPLLVRLTATAATTVTLGPVIVAYTEAGAAGSGT